MGIGEITQNEQFYLFPQYFLCYLKILYPFTTQSRLSTPLEKKALENIVGKEENAGYQHFLLSPTMFSTLPKPNFNSLLTFILSSANALNLDWSKILSFDKELNLYFTSQF